MSTHAMLSPSKRHRWALCPGSVREEAKYPEQPSGPAAIDGTLTHWLLEQCIDLKIDNASSMVGRDLSAAGVTVKVDEARAARAQVALDYIKRRASESDAAAVLAETRVDPGWFTSRDDLGGTVDAQIRTPTTLEIIDYKDGMAPVSAEGNLQLEQYAIGALAVERLGTNVPEQYPWQEVRMTIIQPKMALKGVPVISTTTVSVEHLLSRVSVLSAQAQATDDPSAPLVPGESQCKYCRAKGSCVALAGAAMKEAGITFQPVASEVFDVAQQSADKDPTTMDDGQLRQLIEAAPLLRQLLEAADKEALRRLESGVSIPGLKLVNGRGSRVWSLPEDQMASKLQKLGIPKSSTHVTKLVSPAQAEKLTWAKRDGTRVQLTDRQLKRMEQEYVVKMAGKLTVAPESDSRPAVVTNAAPLFSAVTAAPAAPSLPSWLL